MIDKITAIVFDRDKIGSLQITRFLEPKRAYFTQIWMKNFIVLLCFTFLTPIFARAQDYRITIEIENWQDSTVILAYHYAGRSYVKDTLSVYNEMVVIPTDSSLRAGMYAIVAEQERLLDFLIDKGDQNFAIKTSRNALVDDLIVENSKNNASFFEWVKFLSKSEKERDSLKNELEKASENGEKRAVKSLTAQLEALNLQVETKRREIYSKEPELLSSKLLKAQEEIVPPPQKKKNVHQQQRYLYFKEHYFDHLDLTDEALLFTPIYDQKTDWYFKNLIPSDPDSLIRDADLLIEKAKERAETYRYMVWKATSVAESSPIMGMERAFVYFVDRYYLQDSSLTSPAMRDRMVKRANELRRSMVGAPAANLTIQDSSLRLRSMSSIDADFIILYFFDPNCGHCRSETDSLRSYYRDFKTRYNFEIYAVCSDTSMAKMKDYIRNYDIPWIVVNGPRTLQQGYWDLYDVPSMPTIYLIDRERIILAKRLNAHNTFQLLKIYATQKEE